MIIISSTNSRKSVVYIGNFFFPNGNAAGLRVYNLGKELQNAGYNVIIVGCNNERLFYSDKSENYMSLIDGFPSFSLPYPKTSREWISWCSQYTRAKTILKRISENQDIYAVIFYGAPSISLWSIFLSSWCKRNSILCISDVVDWIETTYGGVVRRFIKWIDTNIQKRFINVQMDGIIAISRYIEDYYSSHGVAVLRVPPLFSHKDNGYENKKYFLLKRKKIMYIGFPFLAKKDNQKKAIKDRVDLIFEVFWHLAKKSYEFDLSIVGFTKDDFLCVFPEKKNQIDEINDFVKFYGKVDHDEINMLWENVDFTILLRDDNIISNAGFPSKIAESISFGIPIITNRTSNIDEYIIEGEDGFFVDISDMSILTMQVSLILELSAQVVADMKSNCRKNPRFEGATYRDDLRSFIENLRC